MAAPPLIRVLESFSEPTAATNPYITQLHAALASTPGLQVRCWTWRTALFGSYDVFHTHWTESLIERRGRLSTAARRVLFALMLLRLRVTRTAVVRTLHNPELPSDLSGIELFLLKATDHLVSMRIVLNEFTPVPPGADSVVIEHGHFRDWFAPYARSSTVPKRLAFIGKVRRYKNVEGLVRAFSALPRDELDFSLHVAGRATSEGLATSLQAAADGDRRITLSLRFIEDEELVREIGQSELVILPFHEMHNSSSVLATLSLDRPVLVPDNQFNRALSDEVGDGWILMFDDELTAGSIVKAIEAVHSKQRDPQPDLSRREWTDTGARHLEAFRRSLGGASSERP
jgi:beta-1,4-mannosyltransferase